MDNIVRKLRYGNGVYAVNGVIKEICQEITQLTERLEDIPQASSEMIEQHCNRVNEMIGIRCQILGRLSKLV